MQSLYVHFPFCESKCHYCDFYSLGREKTRETDPQRFELALKKEAGQKAHLLSNQLDTIFFGGGTPSMTPPDSMRRALEPLELSQRITPNTEWTMEANPSSIELEAMREYRSLGVNRISMGVQAMRSDFLKALGRVHSREAVPKALEAVFQAGFENVSVDLLCGVPEQTENDLKEALEILTQFPITHLSCYLLTLPKQNPMSKLLPDEETQLQHLLWVHEWMTSHGFDHYEISNFAKPGKKARHNLNYWQGRSYLGLGPSAHSYDAQNSLRWKNISSLHRYSALLEKNESVMENEEVLGDAEKQLEKWMLALRLDTGFPTDWLETQLQQKRVEIFENEGLIEKHPTDPTRKRLTARGFALSDQIIRALA